MAHRVARLGLLKTLYANYSTFQARSNAGIRAFVLKTIYKYLPNRKFDPPLFNPSPSTAQTEHDRSLKFGVLSP